MDERETAALYEAVEQITEQAREFGLDFFQMRYEICPADIIYTFGAYAMPTRFSHWSFGKRFYMEKTNYDYGLSKIYELVINSDPCYAFLLDSNTLLQNKLIAAHVLAHCDFFKNNWRFRDTSRQMVWTMATFANRVQAYEHEYGREKVERFLDAVLAIHEHIDPFPARQRPEKQTGVAAREGSPYSDLWGLDKSQRGAAPPAEPARKKPEPSRDLLLFLMERAPELDDWQRDILSSLRGEMLYFRPQMETKIMNEGWASTWHARIMRAMDMTQDEAFEFAKMHAGVLAPSRHSLNPYHLGYKIFEDIEKRYGTAKIFEVREVESDISFLRNYLTRQLVEDLDLYLFKKVQDRYQISANAAEWEKVRDGLVAMLENCGIPYIYAEDSDYQKRGELYLRHGYDGVELDSQYVARTMPHLFHIWQRPVHLETVEDERPVLYTQGAAECERRPL